MKHFEQVWEEAEEVATKVHPDIYSAIKSIEFKLHKLSKIELQEYKEEIAELVGNILFDLSGISKILNVNTHAALITATEDEKVELHAFEHSDD